MWQFPSSSLSADTISIDHQKFLQYKILWLEKPVQLEPKVAVPPAIIAHFHSSHCIPDPSTPLNSQGIDSGTILSDTTPLKRDIPGSEARTSTPPRGASERYADMTFDNCDRFVGPMPVQDFLDDFLPSPEAPASRPRGDLTFSKPSVSQNEVEFASPFTLINVHTIKLTTVLD